MHETIDPVGWIEKVIEGLVDLLDEREKAHNTFCREREKKCSMLFAERQKLYDQQYASQEKAREIAREEMANKLDTLADLQKKIEDYGEQFLLRRIWDAEHKTIKDDVESLKAFRQGSLGRTLFVSFVSGILGAIVVGIVIHFVSK